VFGAVKCGVNDVNTTMLPARTGTASAAFASPQHSKPIGVDRCANVPSRCAPGITVTQPLSGVASVIATQHVRYSCGSTYA